MMNTEVKSLKVIRNKINVSKLGLIPEKEYVVSKGIGHYLIIRSNECWEVLKKKFDTLLERSPNSKEAKQLYRYIIGSACNCKVDFNEDIEIPLFYLDFIAGDECENSNEIYAMQKKVSPEEEPKECYCIGYNIEAMEQNIFREL